MTGKCCFCEGGEWGKFAHAGCLVKASARPHFTVEQIWAYIRYLNHGGPIRTSFGVIQSKDYNRSRTMNKVMKARLGK